MREQNDREARVAGDIQWICPPWHLQIPCRHFSTTRDMSEKVLPREVNEGWTSRKTPDGCVLYTRGVNMTMKHASGSDAPLRILRRGRINSI